MTLPRPAAAPVLLYLVTEDWYFLSHRIPMALAAQRAAVTQNFESQADAFTTSGLLLDDGVIDPAQTRDALGLALAACLEAPIGEAPRFGVFRM